MTLICIIQLSRLYGDVLKLMNDFDLYNSIRLYGDVLKLLNDFDLYNSIRLYGDVRKNVHFF